MYKIILATVVCLVSTSLMAESNIQIGAGYSIYKSTDTYSEGDYEDSVNTPLLAAKYVFTNNIAIEGTYRLKHTDSCTQPTGESCNFSDDIKVSGIDANVLIGHHFTDKDSIYYYSGVGYFSDSWSYTGNGINDTISGLQIPIGVGYNLENLSFEAQYVYRTTKNYSNSSFGINASSPNSTYFGDDVSVNMFSIKLMYAL